MVWVLPEHCNSAFCDFAHSCSQGCFGHTQQQRRNKLFTHCYRVLATPKWWYDQVYIIFNDIIFMLFSIFIQPPISFLRPINYTWPKKWCSLHGVRWDPCASDVPRVLRLSAPLPSRCGCYGPHLAWTWLEWLQHCYVEIFFCAIFRLSKGKQKLARAQKHQKRHNPNLVLTMAGKKRLKHPRTARYIKYIMWQPQAHEHM